jgi:hypothetical protein
MRGLYEQWLLQLRGVAYALVIYRRSHDLLLLRLCPANGKHRAPAAQIVEV